MRFSFAILAATVASATASTLKARQFPSCAISCLNGPDVDTGACSAIDNDCLCRDEVFVSKSTACIVNSCTGDDLEVALAGAQELCRSVGVTLTGDVPAPTSTDASSETQSSASGTPTATSPAVSNTDTSTATGTAPGAEQTDNSASTITMNAFAGLAAFGLAALAL